MTKKTNRQPVLSIVACTDSRGGIGNKGHLLFDIKEDKHNFAMLTRGYRADGARHLRQSA